MHVEPNRLLQLTCVDDILLQPEWTHVQECQQCSQRLVDIIEAAHGNPLRVRSRLKALLLTYHSN
jgi:hypothetical protein